MSDIRFNRWLHQSGTGGIYQDSSGNIGIGTSTPTSALHVESGQIQIGTGTTIHTSGINLGSGTLTSHSINSTGIITASSFAGDASSLTGVSDSNSRRNVARLAVIQAEDSGSSIVNLDNQVIDSFNDDTGIDAVNSSDYFRNTTNKYVVGNIDKLTGTASTDKTTVTIGSTSYNFYQVQSGIATLTVSSAPITFDILVIGGGGGGGAYYAGGGGAGLVVWGRDIELPAPGTYPMEVGEGGVCASLRGSIPTSDYQWGGTPGYATTFAGGTGYALTATGGGGGAGMRWAPHCSNVSVGDPGANGGGGGSHHPGCPTPSFAGGTGSKPTDITADPTNIWGSTSTVTYYGGNSGGGGASNPWGEGGGGGGAGGAGTAGDLSGPTYSDGGDGVQITNMAPDGQTYYWAGGGGGAGAGKYYASQTRGANGGLGGGGGGSNHPGVYGTNGGGAFNSVASSPLGDLNGLGIKNSGGGGGGGSSPKTPGYGDMNGGPGYVLLRSTTANAGITTDMSLVGVTTTASSVPTKSSLIITITEVTGTTTLNTDVKAYVSRDGGTTYTQGTLQSFGATLPSNQVMVGFENLDISSQPSGSSMKYKITTHNQAFGSKSTAIKNVSLSWS
jgi:hypothetical protein